MSAFPLRPVWTLADEVRRVVDPANIPGDVIHYNIPALEATGEPTIEPAADIKSGKLSLTGDEVLISRLNPRKSRVVQARPGVFPILASTEFVPLRPVGCEPRFLAYCLLSETTRQLLDSKVQSVTRSHQRVDPLHVTRLAIPAPGLEEQRRIADFLDEQVSRIDRAIQVRSTQLARMPERVGALAEEHLWPVNVQERAIKRSLVGEPDALIAGPFGSDLLGSDMQGGAFKVFNQASVLDGDFYSMDAAVSAGKAAELSRFAVRPGDLLVTGRGSIGRAAVIPDDAPAGVIHPCLLRVRLTSGFHARPR